MKTNLDTILINDSEFNFNFKIKPDTTLIDKIKPKFLYIDQDIWGSFSDTVKEDLKISTYIIPIKNFITLTSSTTTGLIYTPSSDTEYEILRKKATGGYNYEAQYITQVLTDILNQK